MSEHFQHHWRILQVNTADLGGGAERIAWDLHQGYLARRYPTWLAVGHKRSDDSTVLRIPHEKYWATWIKLAKSLADAPSPLPFRLRQFFSHLAKYHQRRAKKQGHENFYFPGSRHLLRLPPDPPDIVHMHNLHGSYFDLRVLPALSSQVPIVLTLHDAWLLGGHCAHSFDCEQWKTGCENCEHIELSGKLQRDGSAYNWKRKQTILAKSHLYLAAPSQWVMNRVADSILQPAAREKRVIRHGVDLSIFCPTDVQAVRQRLELPSDARILLFIATKPRNNKWKDYATLQAAVQCLSERLPAQPLVFLVVGEGSQQEQVGNATIKYIAPVKNSERIAQYYQSADIYIHAARADNFPNTVMEALACGTPIVATAVGGIPEQIEDGKTGFLVPPQSPQDMASAIQQILQNPDLRQRMSRQAAETAQLRFDVNRMIEEYLSWYKEILS